MDWKCDSSSRLCKYKALISNPSPTKQEEENPTTQPMNQQNKKSNLKQKSLKTTIKKELGGTCKRYLRYS
jgi:hypothetical protein